MNEAIEKIKEIGLDKVHEKTHVSIKSLEDIVNQRFDAIHHIQLTGFLNIIENELHIDVSSIREELKAHRERSGQAGDERKLFIEVPSEEDSKKSLYITLIVIVIAALLYFFSSDDDTPKAKSYQDAIQSSAVEDAKQHLDTQAATSVTAFEKETTTKEEEKVRPLQPARIAPKKKVSIKNRPFVIYPKEPLWVGIINIDNDEQKDTITSEPFPLDETANLLITLGHGYLKIDLNGQVENLSDRGRIRYLYKNGMLSRISASKFKELNKGRSW